MNKWFVALALVSGLCQTRAEGIHWPDHHLLPAFSSPAPVIDCIDVSSASGAEIDLFTSLEGIVNRTQPRIVCVSRADREGEFTWVNLHHLRYVLVRPDQLFMLCNQSAAQSSGDGTRHRDHASIRALPGNRRLMAGMGGKVAMRREVLEFPPAHAVSVLPKKNRS